MDDGNRLQLRERLQERIGARDIAVAERPQVEAPPKLQVKEIVDLIDELDLDVQKMHEGDHHVELTPATPFVEGRGNLNFLLPRTLWCEEGGTASWLAHDAKTLDQDGHLEIWLYGLEEGETYIGQVRVGSIPWEGGPNKFEISMSYGAAFSMNAQGGIGQSIPLFIQDHNYGMALTRITAPRMDWLFFGADFHKI